FNTYTIVVTTPMRRLRGAPASVSSSGAPPTRLATSVTSASLAAWLASSMTKARNERRSPSTTAGAAAAEAAKMRPGRVRRDRSDLPEEIAVGRRAREVEVERFFRVGVDDDVAQVLVAQVRIGDRVHDLLVEVGPYRIRQVVDREAQDRRSDDQCVVRNGRR